MRGYLPRCVLAEQVNTDPESNKIPDDLTKVGIHTFRAFADYMWAMGPDDEKDWIAIGEWLTSVPTDKDPALLDIIWRDMDHRLLSHLLYGSNQHYCHIPAERMAKIGTELASFCEWHLENPMEMYKQYLDVEKATTGLSSFDAPTPEGADGEEAVPLTMDELEKKMLRKAKPPRFGVKFDFAFTPEAIAQRLAPVYKFKHHNWGPARMEWWLGALGLTEEQSKRILRQILDPVLRAQCQQAELEFSSHMSCHQRWCILNKEADHSAACMGGNGTCNEPSIVKMCKGGSGEGLTQNGEPNKAAKFNSLRPFIICPNRDHNALNIPAVAGSGSKPQRAMVYIYLDVWYGERIVQWHYQDGYTIEQIVTELKKQKYLPELASIYRWRAAQGISNPNGWDHPQTLDDVLTPLSQQVQHALTENVRRERALKLLALKKSAMDLHETKFSSFTGGNKRESLQAGKPDAKRRASGQAGVPSHIESGQGYSNLRPAIEAPPNAEGKGQKGKGKGKGKKAKSPEAGKGKQKGKGGKPGKGKKGKGGKSGKDSKEAKPVWSAHGAGSYSANGNWEATESAKPEEGWDYDCLDRWT